MAFPASWHYLHHGVSCIMAFPASWHYLPQRSKTRKEGIGHRGSSRPHACTARQHQGKTKSRKDNSNSFHPH
eukprot:1143736-Pelagomonas_calceolata.AAC.4